MIRTTGCELEDIEALLLECMADTIKAPQKGKCCL